MDAELFVNFYELLELDAAASAEAVERQFRQMVRRYHPDNIATGDRTRFDSIVEAHETLRHPLKRALYDEQHRRHCPPPPPGPDDGVEAGAEGGDDAPAEGVPDEMGIGRDLAVQNAILTLLYQRRRQHIKEPGLGNAELEQLSGCPHEHLEFHLWYLKQKRWIAVEETGLLAITIDGVDRAAAIYRESAGKMLTDQT